MALSRQSPRPADVGTAAGQSGRSRSAIDVAVGVRTIRNELALRTDGPAGDAGPGRDAARRDRAGGPGLRRHLLGRRRPSWRRAWASAGGASAPSAGAPSPSAASGLGGSARRRLAGGLGRRPSRLRSLGGLAAPPSSRPPRRLGAAVAASVGAALLRRRASASAAASARPRSGSPATGASLGDRLGRRRRPAAPASRPRPSPRRPRRRSGCRSASRSGGRRAGRSGPRGRSPATASARAR